MAWDFLSLVKESKIQQKHCKKIYLQDGKACVIWLKLL